MANPTPKKAPRVGDVVLWIDQYGVGKPATVLEVHTPDKPDSILNLFVVTVPRQWVAMNVQAGDTPGCWKRRAGWQQS